MSEGGANPSDQAKQDALYEDREPKKIIRIITVTAYMVSVSFVGITLSAYYIFLWHPPNPRLMHSQAMASHSEAQVGLLSDYESSGPLSARMMTDGQQRVIDLLDQAHQPDEKLKMRREIVKNVNAILRANFERGSSPSEPPDLQTAGTWVPINDSDASNRSSPLDNITESSPPGTETTASAEDIKRAKMNSEAPLSTENLMTTKTTLRSMMTRRPKSPGRKQHQTPFALKHLEVPIKQDATKRRPVRPITTATRRPPTTLDTKEIKHIEYRIKVIQNASKTNKEDENEAEGIAEHNKSRDLADRLGVRMQIPRKMSAHNVMASISRTLGTRSHQHHGEGNKPNEVKFAGEESKDKLYEPKHKQKLVRVLTVVAYIISVSLAAIVLSLYYMYIWDPSDHPHYVAKQRLNVTSAPPGTARTPCPDAGATPPMPELAASAGLADRLNGTSFERTTAVAPSTTDSSSDNTSPQQPHQASKSLYKTLTTPANQRDDYATDLPGVPSISSDQFQAISSNQDEDYSATIQPGEELMDD